MTKISSLTELLGASVDQANDLLPIVDMSETGAARNKKIKITQLLGLITDLVGMLQLKGSTDCSANPNYPVASQGDTYRVSVAGKIGGASGKVVEVSDLYYALADNAGGTEAAVGTSWDVIQGNIVGGATITELDDIPDVNAPTPAAGDVLTWDDTPGEWVAQAPSGITSFALGDATDVDTTGQATGNVLTYDGAQWEPQAPGQDWVLIDQSGSPTGSATWTFSVNVAQVDVTGLAGYTDLMIVARGLTSSGSGIRQIHVSVDNGSSFYSASGDYVSVSDAGAEANAAALLLHDTASTAARSLVGYIFGINVAGAPKFGYGTGTGTNRNRIFIASTNPITAIRLVSGSGNLTGGSLYVFAR